VRFLYFKPPNRINATRPYSTATVSISQVLLALHSLSLVSSDDPARPPSLGAEHNRPCMFVVMGAGNMRSHGMLGVFLTYKHTTAGCC
jgi:hypothetical protein